MAVQAIDALIALIVLNEHIRSGISKIVAIGPAAGEYKNLIDHMVKIDKWLFIGDTKSKDFSDTGYSSVFNSDPIYFDYRHVTDGGCVIYHNQEKSAPENSKIFETLLNRFQLIVEICPSNHSSPYLADNSCVRVSRYQDKNDERNIYFFYTTSETTHQVINYSINYINEAHSHINKSEKNWRSIAMLINLMSYRICMSIAVDLHRSGKIQEAYRLYLYSSIVQPGESDPHRLIAAIDITGEKYPQAIKNIRRACLVDQTSPISAATYSTIFLKYLSTAFGAEEFRKINYTDIVSTFYKDFEIIKKIDNENRDKIILLFCGIITSESINDDVIFFMRFIVDFCKETSEFCSTKSYLTMTIMLLIDNAYVSSDLVAAMRNIYRRVPASQQNEHAIMAKLFYLYYNDKNRKYQRYYKKIMGHIDHLISKNQYSVDKYDKSIKFWLASRLDPACFENINIKIGEHGDIYVKNKHHQFSDIFYFISADKKYWNLYGRYILESISRNVKIKNVHAHVIDPDKETIIMIESISIDYDIKINLSFEYSPEFNDNDMLKTYFSCARFLRAPEIMEIYKCAMLMIDIDSVVVRDITDVKGWNERDLIISQSEKLGPWRQFIAAAIFAKYNEKSITYLEMVGNYIKNAFSSGYAFWTLDQAALYCAFTYLKMYDYDVQAYDYNGEYKGIYFCAMGGESDKKDKLSKAL